MQDKTPVETKNDKTKNDEKMRDIYIEKKTREKI